MSDITIFTGHVGLGLAQSRTSELFSIGQTEGCRIDQPFTRTKTAAVQRQRDAGDDPMKNMLRSEATWVTLVFLIATGAIVGTAPSFRTCMFTRDAHGVWSTVASYKECIGHFTDANANPIIAVFTVVLAISTILLWMATRRLYEAGERQLAHAERQFIATHRPRITVRHVQGPFTIMPDDKLGAAITFANVGQTDAEIVEFGCDLGLRKEDGLWVYPGIDGDAKPVKPLKMAPGDKHVFEAVAKSEPDEDRLDNDIAFLWKMSNQPEGSGRPPNPTFELCLVGDVRYRDATGTIRTTGFWRVFDPTTKRWIADREGGGEYED